MIRLLRLCNDQDNFVKLNLKAGILSSMYFKILVLVIVVGCLASLVPMYTGFARLVPLEKAKLPVWYRFEKVQLPVWSPPLRKIQLIHFLVVVCNIYYQSVLRLPRMTNNQFEGASRLLKKKSHGAYG